MLPRRLSTNITYSPIGAFNNQITLLSAARRSPTGGFLPPEAFASGVWANVSTLQGRDLEKAQQVVAEVSHKIVIRYLSGVTSGMRVQMGNRNFIIEAITDPDEQRVEMHLLCKERNDGAAA